MSDESENPSVSESPQEMQPLKYTPKMIREMKAAGESKPEHVTWGDWMLPSDELSETHKMLGTLVAMGKRNKEIVQLLDLTEQRVSVLKSNSLVKAHIASEKESMFGGDFKARLQNLLMPAIEHLDNTLHDAKANPNLRHDAAKYLIDQTIGKAPQKIEHKGDSLPQILQLIHSLKQSGQVIDVTSSAQSTSHSEDESTPTGATPERSEEQAIEVEARDPIDSWVNDNIPDQSTSIKGGKS